MVRMNVKTGLRGGEVRRLENNFSIDFLVFLAAGEGTTPEESEARPRGNFFRFDIYTQKVCRTGDIYKIFD